MWTYISISFFLTVLSTAVGELCVSSNSGAAQSRNLFMLPQAVGFHFRTEMTPRETDSQGMSRRCIWVRACREVIYMVLVAFK